MSLIEYPTELPNALVDQIIEERGSLLNLYRVLLHNPGITEGWLRLGTAIGSELSIDHRTRELVICEIAAATGATYEWSHHAPEARRHGMTAIELDALADRDVSVFDSRDRAILAAVEVIGTTPQAAESAIRGLRAWFDDRWIAEFVVLIGFYWMVTRTTLALRIGADHR